jgi:hypothetical protein
MGKIPAKTNMISAIILNPLPGDKVPASQTFNVTVQTQHLDAGFFSNPTTNYYTAPQDLNANGDIIGHCHVTVQTLGSSLAPTTPPDPTTFAFFKGIDDAGNGRGLLNAVIDGGLSPGFYRVCTLISAQNHQPVNMPIAQRGAQDDCTKFEVVARDGDGAGKDAPAAPAVGKDAGASATSAAPAASTSADVGAGAGTSNGGSGSTAATRPATTMASAVPSAEAASSAAKSNSGVNTVAMKCGTLGGACPPVTRTRDPRRPFDVSGNSFLDVGSAAQRSCDLQFNLCADAANRGRLPGKRVSDCQAQRNACKAA